VVSRVRTPVKILSRRLDQKESLYGTFFLRSGFAIDLENISRAKPLIVKPSLSKWKEYAEDKWFSRIESHCEEVLQNFTGSYRSHENGRIGILPGLTGASKTYVIRKNPALLPI
jgi:hypothetical protein